VRLGGIVEFTQRVRQGEIVEFTQRVRQGEIVAFSQRVKKRGRIWAWLGKALGQSRVGHFYFKYIWTSPLNFPHFLMLIFQLEQARITPSNLIKYLL